MDKKEKKQMQQEAYNEYVKQVTPTHNLAANMAKAFLVGGVICVIGQFILNICRNYGLDKDTSGLILIAKNDVAHASLSEQFKARTMEKHYRAIAHGSFSKDEGMIDAPIGRHPIDRKKMAVVPNGKPSRTAWRVLEHLSGAAYLDVHLLTGRTHQIRVHMLSIGHPLLGDQIYAPKLKTPVRIPRLMLHAYSLAFTHPTTGEQMRFCAPLPAAFEETLQKLR